jgi:tRNA-specific 2-thiouridylase
MSTGKSAEPIVVGLSGGVDSSVSAYLLKEQGYAVTGLFMKNWEDDDDEEYCSTRQDWIDAAAAADVLGIELEAVNFAAEYKERVFAEFLREYAAGRTPNPDVLCNAEIKFKAFLDHARTLGSRRIATGHYARVRTLAGEVQLLRGVDPGKDQSYFLHRLTQAQLQRTVFPVGHLHKSEVRAIARRIGLPNAAKRDSTGICFIGERPFREFLNRYLPTRPGPMRTPDGTPAGRLVGEHVGLSFYTLGQRKGIGIGGLRAGSGEAWFVARKDMASNTLWVVQGHDHPWLLSTRLQAADASWVAGRAPDAPRAGAHFGAKTRYRQQDGTCTLLGVTGGTFELAFDEPQWAATPGQSAVLYDGEVCLGGGVIDRVETAASISGNVEDFETRAAGGDKLTVIG